MKHTIPALACAHAQPPQVKRYCIAAPCLDKPCLWRSNDYYHTSEL